MSGTEAAAPVAGREFVMTRTIAAPRERVWAAFTDAERMKHWWGPSGASVLTSQMDLRPGGAYRYSLRAPDGTVFAGRFIYRDIVELECLVFDNFFADRDGSIARHPCNPTWPLKTLSAIEFAADDGATLLTVRWSAIDASDEEQVTFDAAHDAMREGWTGTLDKLAAYLAGA